MATQCAFSARLALPSVLRQTFHSHMRADIRSSPTCNVARRHTPHPRLFSSTPQVCSSLKINRAVELITEPAAPHSPGPLSQEPNDVTNISMPSTETGPRQSKAASKNRKRTASTSKKDHTSPDNGVKRDKAEMVTSKKKKKLDHWQAQKGALEKKFPSGWNPPKKLSPDAMDGIRHLHATSPERFTTEILAEEFKVSPESIRRILKSKWRPSESEMDSRRKRWEKRHERIWSQMAELGLRPKTKKARPLSDVNALYKKDHQEE
ncbi:Neugrin-like protein [Penicillium capsulatum]|uniref:Required for respiratory growth protein 9, mitochondrial n=1 Tax=Penicillium capsulatum TaxID=69766 RepID=A0A9W9I9J7_9EURO|nr:Neugrin-like protein [Penicillium capsulatum]KAJ6135461.1 Neugrin-like protein [Penicillium capsulatum]